MAQHLSNLPIGALVKFGKHVVNTETAQPIIWRVVDKNHGGYPSNSVTLMADKIIDLRAYDGNETDSSMGNVDYSLSNINQWLNSDGAAGKWYTASHGYDSAPASSKIDYGTPYDTRSGFLYNFTTDEKSALLPTTVVSQLLADVSKSITVKVFLPSVIELTGTHTYSDGSTQFAGLISSSTAAYLTSQAYNNTTSTSKPANVSTAWGYWTRSTTKGSSASYVSCIGASSISSMEFARRGNVGVRPCVNLSINTKISDTVDSDGCYAVLFNTKPVISGTNSDLGSKADGFKQTYTISDVDNDSISVTEYIDNIALRSFVPTLGSTNTFDITNATWLKLTNGLHTLKVVANDGFDTTERIFTFTKLVNKLVVQRTTPIASTTQPKSIIVSVVKNIPTEAIFKVEACNNGFDTTPTWEDITSDVTRGEIYDFTNTTKKASQWGVNIRVTVDRNGAEGACYITEIGGNFE